VVWGEEMGDVFIFSGKERRLEREGREAVERGETLSSGARNWLSRWFGECESLGRTGRPALETCV
jgi:hypothetical protein